jgi:diguanylate cyclase (GGDEF)-like protein
MSAPPTTTAADLVPLAERLRAMRWCRFAFAIGIAAAWLALPEVRHLDFGVLAAAAAGWIAVTALVEVVARGRRWAFGLLLTIDGVFLAAFGWGMAGVDAPLRYLVLLHIIAASLLASFRTGLKLALWHSLLLFTVFYAQEARIIESHGGGVVALGDVEFHSLAVYTAAFWAAAIAVSTFAAVNERELRRRRYDLEALRRLSDRIERLDGTDQISNELTTAAVEELDFPRAALFLAARGELDSDVLRRAAEAPEPLLLSHADDPRIAQALPGARNLVLVPLRAESRLVGVLVCEHGLRRGSRVERRAVGMLARFSSHAALALANAELLDQLRRSAAVDGLTGVANRRSFDETLGREVARAARGNAHLGVVLVDLDHFKALNDGHGHLAGDEALRTVAAALRDASRGADTVARFGGEEFAVLLPDADVEETAAMAERLREIVAECPAPITASLGTAGYPGDGLTGTALVDAADRALYAAKRLGRDRVVSAATVDG